MTLSAAAGTNARSEWKLGPRTIEIHKPILMGIVNVTPDSFSDGGVSFSTERAVERALGLLEQGADIVDVGGESTRPGATSIALEEELRRVIPVIEGILRVSPRALVSVDTVKSGVATRALAAGALLVNDVSALRLDDAMAGVCAQAACGVVLMHSRGDVADMASYTHAEYGDEPVNDVLRELRDAADRALAAGVAAASIVVDPGFGFSKTTAHSLAILRDLPRICELGYPVLVGLSRKRMIGELTGVARAADRDPGSVGVAVLALAHGARLFRVHEVRAHREALDAAWGVISNSVTS